jgi:hypothetical protein
MVLEALIMANGDGPSPGEIARSQLRIETALSRMETVGEERHNVVLAQVSDVRHRVANLEAIRVLSDGFVERVGALFDRVDALEKSELRDRAVDEFKTKLRVTILGGSVLGAVVVILQIISLLEG